MDNQQKKLNLRNKIEMLYEIYNNKLPFHGWHHIFFVKNKAIEFARLIGADSFLVESAALVHDLNYTIQVNSEPEIASDLRIKILTEAGYTKNEIDKIEKIISDAHLSNRIKCKKQISKEGKALSDADALFKSLPITPILFTSKYLTENNVTISQLAKKIVSEQSNLLKNNKYFYTSSAKEQYEKWANVNLDLWNNVIESLEDKDVKEILMMAMHYGILDNV